MLPLWTSSLLLLVASAPDASEGAARWRRSGGYPKFPFHNAAASPDVGCGTRDVTHRSHTHALAKIVGGADSVYGDFPWQVDIQTRNGARFEHNCGGAVVSERVVVTAAHCVHSRSAAEMRVVVGKHHLSEKDQFEQVFRVDKILTHPDYRKQGSYSNDIALVGVAAPGIRFNSHVRPICLPAPVGRSGGADAGVGDAPWCTVTGWGAVAEERPEQLPTVLQAAAVPLLAQETCRDKDVYGGRHQSILDSMLCAGLLSGGVDACGGDSGGPLACEEGGRFVLTGVVSWGDGCAKKGRPGVYTRVSHFTAWILDSLSDKLAL